MADQPKVLVVTSKLLPGSTNPPALGAPTPLPAFSGALDCAQAEGAAAWRPGASGFKAGLPPSGPWAPHNLDLKLPSQHRIPTFFQQARHLYLPART